jgi:hypothetical protein
MKNKPHCLRAAFAVVALVSVLFSGICPAFAKDEDFGIWNAYDVEAKVKKIWRLKAGEELRYRENTGLHYFDTHVGVSNHAINHFAFGADYLQVREKRKVGKKEEWFWEYRPRIMAMLHTTLYGYFLEYRNMLEFRMKESAKHVIEDRNLVSVTAPYQWTPLKLQPYTSNEFFFDFRGGRGFVQDRLIGGFKFRLYKGLGGSIFYMRQFTKSKAAKWVDYNILGINFKLSL